LIKGYSGLSFYQIQELDLCDYLQLRRDAFISKCNESEGGREYLEKCWLLEQTKPDREKLKMINK